MGGSAVLGIGLALVGTLCSAIGYTLQKLAHRKADADSKHEHAPGTAEPAQVPSDDESTDVEAPPKPPVKVSYWKYWQFPAGLGMLVVGAVFAVITTGMAGQAELAPMSATTMIWNMVLAWKILKEPFGRYDATALLLMSAGTTIALVFAERTSRDYTLDDIVALLHRDAVWIYSTISLTAVFAGVAVVHVLGKKKPSELTRKQARIDATGRSLIAGMLGGYTGFLVKAVVEVVFYAIGSGDWAGMQRFEPYMFLIALPLCLFNQVRYMNSGLARYESSRIIPVYQSTLVFSGVAAGFTYWDEIAAQTSRSLLLFGIGCSTTFCGMLVLMWKPHPSGLTAGVVTAAANAPVTVAITRPEIEMPAHEEGVVVETKDGGMSVQSAFDTPHYARHRPTHLRQPSLGVPVDGGKKSSTHSGSSHTLADTAAWLQTQAASVRKSVSASWAPKYSPLADTEGRQVSVGSATTDETAVIQVFVEGAAGNTSVNNDTLEPRTQ